LRQIFIGDVQGCAEELETLLGRADAAFGSDWVLWQVGDLVNRGPASLRVLERVRSLCEQGRARCVLGNHEISLISTAWGLRPLRPTDSFGDVLSSRDSEDWIEWLRALPLAITGRAGSQEFAMLHAAVNPDWDLAALRATAERVSARLSGSRRAARAFLAADVARDPDRNELARLTTCRSVFADGRWSAEPPGGEAVAWHHAWRERGHEYGIAYGHWSLQGLHVAPGLRGLDTGCVHHGRGRDGFLTAWIPDTTRTLPFGVPDDHFWQERARGVYYKGPAET
jgi:bis(5'-nucleosyl)-tetraphosphatase (symmetrical)